MAMDGSCGARPAKKRRLVAMVVLLPAALFAGDGTIEINQTYATLGGVTATDSPGFPVTIDASGSYRLTGNLDVTGGPALLGGGSADVTVILVAADDVTIDLNGFSILGSNDCAPPPCSNSGLGRGVSAVSRRRVTVRDGYVRGMGEVGIYLGDHGRIESVTAYWNGSAGFICTNGCELRDLNAIQNGGAGLVVLDQSLVSGSLFAHNGGAGIDSFGGGSLLTDNIFNRNATTGVHSAGTTLAVGRSTFNHNGLQGGPQFDGAVVELGENVCGAALNCP